MIEILFLWFGLTICGLYTFWFFGTRDHNEKDFVDTIFCYNIGIVLCTIISLYIDPDFNNDRLIINVVMLNIVLNAVILRYRHNINIGHQNGYSSIY